MLGDCHPHRRNVEDLASFIADTGARCQRSLALGTDCNGVALNMLRLHHRLKLMPGMPSLGARFLAAGCRRLRVFGFLRPSLEGGLLLLPLCLANWSSKTWIRASSAQTISAKAAKAVTTASSPWRYRTRTSSEVGRRTDVMMATVANVYLSYVERRRRSRQTG